MVRNRIIITETKYFGIKFWVGRMFYGESGKNGSPKLRVRPSSWKEGVGEPLSARALLEEGRGQGCPWDPKQASVFGQFGCIWPYLPSLGKPNWTYFYQIVAKILQFSNKIHLNCCFPIHNRPQHVCGIVHRTSGINFSRGISRNGHTINGKLIFQHFF